MLSMSGLSRMGSSSSAVCPVSSGKSNGWPLSKPRIGVVGWYDHNNVGDESYKLSFPRLFPQYDFVFDNAPPPDVSAYVLGGGDVICEHHLHKLSLVDKPKHILSATCSCDLPLEGFTNVAVRDQPSLERAIANGASASLVPDFAFGLDFDRERGRSLIESLFQGQEKEMYQQVVAVVLNGNLLPRNADPAWKVWNADAFFHMMAHVADHTNASFLFLPFGIEPQPLDDRVANGWAASKCKYHRKNHVVFECPRVQDTIDIISAVDAVVSSRLHSSIFACITSTPFVDITHGHKNAAFLHSVGLEKLSLSYPGFGADEFKEKLKGIIGKSDELKKELSEITAKEKESLGTFVRNVCLV